MKIQSHRLINQDSGNCEYYTPLRIIDAARKTMGSIDLDPASSKAANRFVQAKVFYDKNGPDLGWFGNVFLNHPFSRDRNPLWISKLVHEFESGRVNQAICITFAATSEKWFQPLLAQPQCYLVPRTNYRMPDGSTKKGVTKGSVVTYFHRGSRNTALYNFREAFEGLGVVKV